MNLVVSFLLGAGIGTIAVTPMAIGVTVQLKRDIRRLSSERP